MEQTKYEFAEGMHCVLLSWAHLSECVAVLISKYTS